MKRARDKVDLAPDIGISGALTSQGARKAEKYETEEGPERTCIVTRTKGSPQEMIRFVLGPDLVVVPDIRHKLPGRGVWVTARATKVAEAVKRQAFARGFKVKAVAPASLPDDLDTLLRQDCHQFISLVNKAGLIVTGFAKVEAAVESGHIAGLLHASDAGADGVRKLGQTLRRRFGEDRMPPQIKLFTGDELDLALGRTNVIHAALLAGATSDAFITRCLRLMAYRSDTSSSQSGRPEDLASSDDQNRGSEAGLD